MRALLKRLCFPVRQTWPYRACFLAFLACLLVAVAEKKVQAAYITRYCAYTSGAVTFTGNTLGLDKATNTNGPGTNGSIGCFTDMNTDSAGNTMYDWNINVSVEAENMTLTNYSIESNPVASGTRCIAITNPASIGRAAYTYTGASGTYRLRVYYFDENDGSCTYTVNRRRSGITTQIATWTADQQLGSANPEGRTYTSRTISNVGLNTNDIIWLEATQNGQEPGRYDKLEIVTNSASAWPANTTSDWRLNSSRAVLNMPAGSTVLYAELIWAGSYNYSGEDVSAYLDNPVAFTTPLGSMYDISPDPQTSRDAAPLKNFYIRSQDVTSYVRAAGAGTYTVGRVPGTQNEMAQSDNFCGWTLAVIYENQDLPIRSLSLFVGGELAHDTIGTEVSFLHGFCTPTFRPVGADDFGARLLASTGEGDMSLTGDQMLFGVDTDHMANVTGLNNQTANFFASQINNDNGTIDTTGTPGTPNHSYPGRLVAGARQGWDIANVDVRSLMDYGQTDAVVRGMTNGDGYLMVGIGLQIDIGAPRFPTDTLSADKTTVVKGDRVTYTCVLDNTLGTIDAVDTVFTDVLPWGLQFVPGSFTIDGVAQPGADPADGVYIGTVPLGHTITLTFQADVMAVPPAPAIAQYVDTASWSYRFQSAIFLPWLHHEVTSDPWTIHTARLSATKTANTATLVAGGTITYTVTVSNTGTANTSGTTLADPIPGGVTYRPGTTYLNNALIADGAGNTMPYATAHPINSPTGGSGVIVAGENATLRFDVRVDNPAPPSVLNIATIDQDGGGPLLSFDVFHAIPPGAIPTADLGVVLTHTGDAVAGDPFTYNVTVTNAAGSSTVTSCNLTFTLPSQLAGAVYNPTSGGSYDPYTGAWTGISLAANGSIAMTITGNLSPTASGNISATATVSPPAGVTDNNSANNTSTDTAAVQSRADLEVAIDDGHTVVQRGENLTYNITVSNHGPGTTTSVYLIDTIPAALLNAVLTPGDGTYNPDTHLWNNLHLATGDTASFTVTGMVDPAATGSLAVTAHVDPPAGTTDPDTNNNTAVDTDAIAASDLGVAITDGQTSAVAGNPLTYTVTVTNAAGSATVTSCGLTFALPAGLGGAVYTPSEGAYDAGTGQWTGLNLAANGSVTMTVAGTLSPTVTGNITATAAVSPPSSVYDPNAANNNASDVDTVAIQADLGVQKTDGVDEVARGDNVTYTITVTNNGPSALNSLYVTDTIPAELVNTTITPQAGSYNPTTHLLSGLNLDPGGRVMLTLSGTVSNTASGDLTNTVTVGPPAGALPDPVPGNDTAADTDTILTGVPVFNLAAAKSSIPTTVTAGNTTITYTVNLQNTGTADAIDVVFTDTLPWGLQFVADSLTIDGVAQPGVNPADGVPIGGVNRSQTVVVTFQATVEAVPLAPAAAEYRNTASWTYQYQPAPGEPLRNGEVTTNPCVVTVPRLSVTKTVVASGQQNRTLDYTITVTNNGTAPTAGTTLFDPVPALCTYTAGSTRLNGTLVPDVSGAMPFSQTAQLIGSSSRNGIIAVGATATITFRVTRPRNTTVTNIAHVDPDGAGSWPEIIASVTYPAPANSDLAVTLTDGPTVAGTQITYASVITNNGPGAITSCGFVFTPPDGLTGVVFTPVSGSYDPDTGQWTGLNVASGGHVDMTIIGDLAPAATGSIAATATVSPPSGVTDPNLANNSATHTDIVAVQADLSIAKDDGRDTVVGGDAVTYTITVTNAGPSTLTSLTLTDAVPAALLDPVFAPQQGLYSPTSQLWTGLKLAPGGTAVLTLSGTVDHGASGSLDNDVTVAPPAGATDPNNANNSAEDIDTILVQADLSIAKTDGRTTVGAGDAVTYTITVTNAGPSTLTSIIVTDTMPAALLDPVFEPEQGTYDPVTHIWSGLNLAAGGSVVLTLSGTVDSGASGTLDNTVTVAPPAGATDPDMTNNSAADSDTIAGLSISGYVYNDADHDASRDWREAGTGVAGLYAKLLPSGGGDALQAAAVNPATGVYEFTSVAAGTYTVIIDDNAVLTDTAPSRPAGWIGTEAPAQSVGPVTLTTFSLTGINFGLWHGSRIDGTVFRDDGAGGGTANDGIRQGAEAGLTGVRVWAETGGITIDTITTGGGGNYTLWIEAGDAGPIAVRENNPANYISVGGSAGSTGGAYDRALDGTAFTCQAGQSYTGANFADVPASSLSPGSNKEAMAGAAVFFPHVFTAGTAGSVVFAVTCISSPAAPAWLATLYLDADGDGSLDPGEAALTTAQTVVAGQHVHLLIKVYIPAGAPFGADARIGLTAAFTLTNASPPLILSLAATDTVDAVTPSAAGLTLIKSADRQAVLPGEQITYTIAFTNISGGFLTALAISDATPVFTVFAGADYGPLPADLTACAITSPSIGAFGTITWTFTGSLAPGATGYVVYRAIVAQ